MDQVKYLQSLQAIRDRTGAVFAKASANQLNHFDFHPANLQPCVDFVVELMRRDYASVDDVPPHARWRHFNVNSIQRVDNLIQTPDWQQHDSCDDLETARRLVDLFSVSVLLDAGAGDKWKYTEAATKQVIGRSEGLAVASFNMFCAGQFSSDSACKYRADSLALSKLATETLSKAMQHSIENPLVGVEGRTELLVKLGKSVQNHTDIFPPHSQLTGRPGNLIDYLLSHPTTKTSELKHVVQMSTLWDAIITGFGDVWPASRTKLDGQSLGDVWPCQALSSQSEVNSTSDNLVPFHKLSQWLTYSLMEPMMRYASIEFAGMEAMTGLAEYRNGGLFVDFGVITLKQSAHDRGMETAKQHATDANADFVPLFAPSDDVIVEWRAMTVALLDQVGQKVRAVFGKTEQQMPLVKVLEGGTWKAGREIAAKKRPVGRGPPIQIISDGTVF